MVGKALELACHWVVGLMLFHWVDSELGYSMRSKFTIALTFASWFPLDLHEPPQLVCLELIPIWFARSGRELRDEKT